MSNELSEVKFKGSLCLKFKLKSKLSDKFMNYDYILNKKLMRQLGRAGSSSKLYFLFVIAYMSYKNTCDVYFDDSSHDCLIDAVVKIE